MNRAQLLAAVAYWKAKEVAAYREWQRLVKKGASTLPGKKRDLAFKAYNHAHQMRVRRDVDLRKLAVEHVDDNGANKLADREGVIPYAYLDSQGYPTAWIGHLIELKRRPLTTADFNKWGSRAHPAPHDKIVKFFREVDLIPYERVVTQANEKRIKNGFPSITQNQFNACVSLAFNIGTGGFATSTVAKRIAAGENAQAVASAFMLWHRPPEIIGRRQGESKQYANG